MAIMMHRFAEVRIGLRSVQQREVAAQAFRLFVFAATLVLTPIALLTTVNESMAIREWLGVLSAILLTASLNLVSLRHPKNTVIFCNAILLICMVAGNAIEIAAALAFITATVLIALFGTVADLFIPRLVDWKLVRSAVCDFLGTTPRGKLHYSPTLPTRKSSLHRNRQVVLTPDRVAKLSEPAATRVELERTEHATGIADTTGGFSVPRIVDSDVDNGLIVFERLYNVEPLWITLARDSQQRQLLVRCGKALASIHNTRIPEAWQAEKISGPWAFNQFNASASVLLHGDFNDWNVLVDRDTNGITIIDWATSDVCDGSGIVGPPQFDVAWFIVSLFRHRYGGRRRIDRPEDCIDWFLSGYESVRYINFDRDAMQAYWQHVLPEIKRQFSPTGRSLRQRVQRFMNFDVDIEALKSLNFTRDESPEQMNRAA